VLACFKKDGFDRDVHLEHRTWEAYLASLRASRRTIVIIFFIAFSFCSLRGPGLHPGLQPFAILQRVPGDRLNRFAKTIPSGEHYCSAATQRSSVLLFLSIAEQILDRLHGKK